MTVFPRIQAERRGIERGDPDDRWAAILRMPDGQLAQTCAEVGVAPTDPTRQGMLQALGDFLRDHNQGARLLECVRCGCSSRFRGGERVCWCDPCAADGCAYGVHNEDERPPDRCADPLMNTYYYAFGLIWLRNIYFYWKSLLTQNCQSQISPNAS